MSEQLVNYVLQQINAGYKVDDIENYLKNYGYNVSDVVSSIKTAIDITARGYIGFIDQQINSGFKLPQVRSSLVEQGYDYRIVDHALNHYHGNFLSLIKNKMENFVEEENKKKQLSNQINSSIRDGLNYGLTLENIQSNLIGQGFDVNLITKEINRFRQTQLHIPKNTLVIAIFAVVLVGIGFGVFSLVLGPTNPAMQGRLLDVRAENSQPDMSLYPGSRLHFHVERVPMGYQREFDIDFEYRIYDRSDNLITFSSATKSVVSNLGDRILIPSRTEPGTYRFEVIAEYKGEVHARSSFEFLVEEKEEVSQPAQEKPSDIEPIENITDEYEDDQSSIPPQVPQTPEIPQTPLVPPPAEEPDDPDAEFAEIGATRTLRISDQNRIRALIARNDTNYALYLCDKIRDGPTSADCRIFVGIEIDDVGVCDALEGIQKDKCLSEFGKRSVDDSICEQISNPSFKSLCRIYVVRNKNLGLQHIDDEQEYREKINELYG